MSYIYKATPRFWKSFRSLTVQQREAAREAFKVFRADPFHPSLRTHAIVRLSGIYGRVVYSATILPDLRAIFTIKHGVLVTLDIGTHAIYK